MRDSRTGLCGGGEGGVFMSELRMELKWSERWWRPGSILMEGDRLFMNRASLMPLRCQSCSVLRMLTSSLRK